MTLIREFQATNANAPYLPMFIADVLRHDAIEQIDNIANMLNNRGCIGWRDMWPHDFTHEEIASGLRALIEQDFVDAVEYDEHGIQHNLSIAEVAGRSSLHSLWFHLNKAGMHAWENWTPPPSSSSV